MTRRCVICDNKRIVAIDRALLAGDVSLRRIAGDFGISESSLRRHKAKCLANRLAAASEQHREADVVTAIDVREQLGRINSTAHAILNEARESGDARLALRALDRIEKQLTLAAKLADMLHDGPSVQVAISVDSGWPALRSVILETLATYPAALQAVSDRLATLEATK